MAKSSKKSQQNSETKKTDVVSPLVRVAGEKHLLEELMEGPSEDLPEIKSIGYARLDKSQRHGWVSYVITTKGDKVLKIEISEPDMREIAEESSKEAFVTEFMNAELM